MPYGGSVNQIVPSFATQASFGEFRRLPLYVEQRTSTFPSRSVRLTWRPLCSHETTRPRASTALPLVLRDGFRQTSRPFAGVHRWIVSAGMSLKSRHPSASCQTGPSVNVRPSAIGRTFESARTTALNDSSMTSMPASRFVGGSLA